MKRILPFLVSILLFSVNNLNAQLYLNITLEEYLAKVESKNLELLAKRLEIDVADAAILVATEVENPTFSITYYNNEERRQHLGEGVIAELSQTIAPGKRAAEKRVAMSEKEMAQALLLDSYRELRKEATQLWLEAVKNRQLIQIKRDSYYGQLKLMETDSIARGQEFNLDLDILQNKVETGFLYLEILELENEVNNLYRDLTSLSGISVCDTIIIPDKRNIYNNRSYVACDLKAIALKNRSDYLAAKIAVELAENELRAAKRDRIPEFELTLGYSINREVTNIEAPTPAFKGVEVGLAFPIPIFNRNRGEILAAQYEKKANEHLFKEAENNLINEVFSAYDKFIYCTQKLDLFRSGLVKNAMDALEEKRSEYYQGKTHLIEVLDAQRSYDEILTSFYSVIYDKSQALVNLESTLGLWRIFEPMDSF